MKWEDLTAILQGDSVFRTGRLMAGQASAADVRRQVSRWIESGRLIQLRRGVYSVAPRYARSEQPHPFVVANTLRTASYVSLHSALAHHGMIPEHVPVTTSITTKRPEELETGLGRFLFRHVSPKLFFGFADRPLSGGQHALIATPEKALFDLLYLTPRSDDRSYLRELRLEFVTSFSISRLEEVADRAGSVKVARAARMLRKLQ